MLLKGAPILALYKSSVVLCKWCWCPRLSVDMLTQRKKERRKKRRVEAPPTNDPVSATPSSIELINWWKPEITRLFHSVLTEGPASVSQVHLPHSPTTKPVPVSIQIG